MVKTRILKSPVGGEPLEFEWPLTEEEISWVLELISCVGEQFPNLGIDLNTMIEYSSTNFRDLEGIETLFDQFNRIVVNSMVKQGTRRTVEKEWASKESLKYILELVYKRAVKNPFTLNKYKQFSALVYGETSYELMCDIINSVKIDEGDIFMDLGCGIGQLVVQMAAATSCKMCYGIEKADIPSSYLVPMDKNFKAIMQWFGKKHGQYELLTGDFLAEEFQSKIKSSTIVLLNNLLFGPQLNFALSERLAAMENNTVIISSNSFACLKSRKITERNSRDIRSIIQLVKTVKGSVSWTNRKVNYYIQKIDRKDLNSYLNKAKEGANTSDSKCSKKSYGNEEVDIQKQSSKQNRGCERTVPSVITRSEKPLRQVQPKAGYEDNQLRHTPESNPVQISDEEETQNKLANNFIKELTDVNQNLDKKWEFTPNITNLDSNLTVRTPTKIAGKSNLVRNLELSPDITDLGRGLATKPFGKIAEKSTRAKKRELSPDIIDLGRGLATKTFGKIAEKSTRTKKRELSPDIIDLGRGLTSNTSRKITEKSNLTRKREISPDIIDLPRLGRAKGAVKTLFK